MGVKQLAKDDVIRPNDLCDVGLFFLGLAELVGAAMCDTAHPLVVAMRMRAYRHNLESYQEHRGCTHALLGKQ